VDLEETLDKVVEMAREELDHYAHQLYRLHDAEYADGWRHHSAGDRS
jgi:hypothetical protein